MRVHVRFDQTGTDVGSPWYNIPYISLSVLYMSVFN